MAFRAPFAAYNAADNLQAQMVADHLRAEGIEAIVSEDNSPAGVWMLGHIAEIHKPQVWIERSDIDRVKPLLDEFERKLAERRQDDDVAKPIAVICPNCQTTSHFAFGQNGTVQDCPQCGGFVDVGEIEEIEGWDIASEDEPDESTDD